MQETCLLASFDVGAAPARDRDRHARESPGALAGRARARPAWPRRRRPRDPAADDDARRPDPRPHAGQGRRQGPVREGARERARGRPRRPRRALAQGRADGPAAGLRARRRPRARGPARRLRLEPLRLARRAADGRRRRHVQPAPRRPARCAAARPAHRAAARQPRHAPAQARRRALRRHRPRGGGPGAAGPGGAHPRQLRAARDAAVRRSGRARHRDARRRASTQRAPRRRSTHRPTQLAVLAERAVSRTLGGSCSMPLAAHARWRGGRLELQALVGSRAAAPVAAAARKQRRRDRRRAWRRGARTALRRGADRRRRHRLPGVGGSGLARSRHGRERHPAGARRRHPARRAGRAMGPAAAAAAASRPLSLPLIDIVAAADPRPLAGRVADPRTAAPASSSSASTPCATSSRRGRLTCRGRRRRSPRRPGRARSRALQRAGSRRQHHRRAGARCGAVRLRVALATPARSRLDREPSVLVVRGGGGRDWLADRLADAGADRRPRRRATRDRCPLLDAPARERLDDLAGRDGVVWLFSSSLAIAHLEQLAGSGRWSTTAALATHPRIADRARQAGFGRVVEAGPASTPWSPAYNRCDRERRPHARRSITGIPRSRRQRSTEACARAFESHTPHRSRC